MKITYLKTEQIIFIGDDLQDFYLLLTTLVVLAKDIYIFGYTDKPNYLFHKLDEINLHN